MKRRLKFTLYHGFAASLALHSALGLPLVVYGWALPPEEPPMLVVELQGVVADSQTEQKVQQETKGEAKQDEAKKEETKQEQAKQEQAKQDEPEIAKPAEAAASPPPPAEEPPTEVAADEKEAPPAPAPPEPTRPPPAVTKSGSAGANNTSGVEERQIAQTIKTDQEEIDRLKDYVKLLTKKVQANLVYPDEGRRAGLQGAATVSFTLLGNGQIRPESLKIIESSGQPKLDASALKTIRASVPFDPPPKEMTVAIAVAFGRKP